MDMYKQLNEQQKRAVDLIDGPVLVLAGPGTGKTQLLSMRVANVLVKTDTDASSILCLTFTNKAATNMRDRLAQLIGPMARDITVKTFHSFAAELMNQYPDHFWSGARLTTAPEAVQLEVIEDILGRLPLNNPLALKFAGTYTAVGDVQEALKLTKEAGLTPSRLKAIIEANLAYIDVIEPLLVKLLDPPLSVKKVKQLGRDIERLPNQEISSHVAPLLSLSDVIKDSFENSAAMDSLTGKTVSIAKWKKRLIQTVDGKKGMYDERKRNMWWLSVSDVYSSYRTELRRRGHYDYADMLVEVISQLQESADMRASVQERYLYVLIDEFQDTNAAQLRLAHLVAEHYTNFGKPNLMAVGDDDQSIFKFNGAELNNLLSFERMYPSTKRIVLIDNYRSSQEILNTAKQIIEQSTDRLVARDPNLKKDLQAVNPPKRKGYIKHIRYPTVEHQYFAVSQLVKDMYDKKDAAIAVLARGHDSLQQIAGMLLRMKVPVQYERQSNILEHEAVHQINLIAEIAVAIKDGNHAEVNEKIALSLHHPMWGVKAEQLWRLATANYAEPKWLESMLKSSDERIKSIGKWLLWLGGQATTMPLGQAMEFIIGVREDKHGMSPIKRYFTEPQKVGEINDKYLHALSAVLLLRSLVHEFAYRQDPRLSDFVRFIELNRNNRKIIADESLFVSSDNAVQLLTVHKAKGLEFDRVIIVDAVEDIWKPRTGGRKPPMNLPLQPYGDDYDDFVRLMYVAATRSKHTLIFTNFYSDKNGQEVLPAPFIRTATEPLKIEIKESDQPVEVLEEALRWPRLDPADEFKLLKNKLDNLKISATGLTNFLDVTRGPNYYFEHNLLRLPKAREPYESYGSALHTALEEAQKLTNNRRFRLAAVHRAFKSALYGEAMLASEFARYLAHGTEVLDRLFKNKLIQLTPGSLTEQKISDAEINGVKIRGRIDRIDVFDKKSILIADYKTGKPLHSFYTKDINKAIKAWRQRTQLIFYMLLVGNTARYRHKTIAGKVIYVEAERAENMELFYNTDERELQRLIQLMQAVWEHTKSLNFPDVSGYSHDYKGIAEFEEDLIKGKI